MLRDNVLRGGVGSQRYTTNTTVRVVAVDVVKPTARLTSKSGSIVSSCSSIVLDASGSHGGGGRPLRYRWRVQGDRHAVPLNLTLAVGELRSSRVRLAPSYFTSGRTYHFTVSVFSEWHTTSDPGNPANASVSVNIAVGAVPTVGILGGQARTVSLSSLRGDYFKLHGVWSVTQCPGVTLAARFDPPSWHVLATTAAPLVVPCTASYDVAQPACTDGGATFDGHPRLPHTRGRGLLLPKHALRPGTAYTLGLFVNMHNEHARNNTATMVLTIAHSPLVARISGAEEATVASNHAIVLDATSSSDPDNSSTAGKWFSFFLFLETRMGFCSTNFWTIFGSKHWELTRIHHSRVCV